MAERTIYRIPIYCMIKMVYEFLDHKSDVYVHVTSSSLSRAFEDAAAATFEVMLEQGSVRCKKTIDLKIEATDVEQLLYMWVDRLLYHFDADSFALARAEVKSLRRRGNGKGKDNGPDKEDGKGGFSLSARLHGEDYNPEMHGQKVGVKAMTYSLMMISKGAAGKAELHFVLDI